MAAWIVKQAPLGPCVLLCFLLAVPSCGRPGALTDEEKRSRIEALYNEYQPEFAHAPELTVEEFDSLEKPDEVVVVDVREPEERAVSILRGSLSKAEFEAQAEELKDRKIVVHCTIGYRSGLYVEKLVRRGFDAWNLKGSILSWAHAGGGFVTPDGQDTKRVHVYGKTWDLLPEGYEAVW